MTVLLQCCALCAASTWFAKLDYGRNGPVKMTLCLALELVVSALTRRVVFRPPVPLSPGEK